MQLTIVSPFYNEKEIDRNKFPFLVSAVNSISACSLGIFLTHTIFIQLLRKGTLGFILSGYVENPLFRIPLTAILTFGLTFGLVLILRKIPILKRVIP